MYESEKLFALMDTITNTCLAERGYYSNTIYTVEPGHYAAYDLASQLVQQIRNLDDLAIVSKLQKAMLWFDLCGAAYMVMLALADKIQALHARGAFTNTQMAVLRDAYIEAGEERERARNALSVYLQADAERPGGQAKN